MIAREVIRTILEIAAVGLLIYGIAHEDELVRLEHRIFKAIKRLCKAHKTIKIASLTQTGQVTRVQSRTQNRGVYGNVRNFPVESPITRRRK